MARLPRSSLSASVIALTSLLATTASAQEFWLVPQTPTLHSLADAHDIPVHLYLGRHLIAEKEVRFFAARTKRFALVHGTSSQDLLPAEPPGALPFAHLALDADGGHLAVLDRTPQDFTTPPADFDNDLRQSHFLDALAERERRGESSKPGRERLTRYFKALLQVGDARDETFGRGMEQELEIIPQSNPAFASPGATLPVLLEFRGHPLANATLGVLSRVADPLSLGAPEVLVTTDERGTAMVPIPRRAFFVLLAGHMIRCEQCADADWESFEASYVFSNADPREGTTMAPEMSNGPVRADPIAPERSWKDVAAAVAVIGASSAILWVVRRKRRREP